MKSPFMKVGFALIAILLTLGTASCKKEKNTLVQVRVVDTSDTPVTDAMVRLYPTPTIPPPNAVVIDDTLETKIDGYAIFDFTEDFNLGQAGFAVLDIECRSADQTLYGQGIVKVEEEKTSTVTVVLQP